MKKLFSFLLIVVLISCSKDPVIYTLTATANPAEGGSVSPSSQQYDSGDVATVTATASSEYVFQSWSGSASGSSPSTTVTMDSDKAVVANFVKKKYALTINVEGEGSVTEKVIKAGLATDYNSGTIVELTAVPEGEWLFVEWKGDLTGSENPKEITIDKAKTVTAVFVKKQYPLTIEIEGEGTVTEEVIKAGVATDYNSGTIVELTAVPTGDWEFIEWSGDITSTENPAQITIDGPKTVKVKFSRYFGEYYNKPSYELDITHLWVDYFDMLGYPEKRDSIVKLYTGEYPLYKIAVGMPEVYGDFNYDGYLDILLAPSVMTQPPGGYGDEPLWFFKNEGDDKTFTFDELDIENHIGQWGASAGLLGDFNGDGKPDVIYAEGGKDVYLGKGTSPTMLLSKDEGFEMKDLSLNTMMYGQAASGDIDNDGDLDVIMGALGALTVFKNDGQANFSEYFQYVDPSYGYSSDNSIIELLEPVTSGGGMLNVDLYDINKDGYLDLIGGWENAGRQLAIYYGNGVNFTKDRMVVLPYTSGWENLMNVNFYDVDNDGNDEIIVGRSDMYITNGWYMELLKLNDNGEYYIVDGGFDNSSSSDIEFFLNTNVRDIDSNGYVDVYCRDRGQGGNGEFRFEWNGSSFEKRF
jgi:hypothetical protein